MGLHGRVRCTPAVGAAAVLLLSLAAGDGARAHPAARPASPSAGLPAEALLRLQVVGHVGGAMTALDCQAGRCYASAGDRVAVIAASDPSRPVLLGETELLPAPPDLVVAADDRAYVLCRAGLAIVDARDPERPRVAAWVDGVPADLHPGAALAAEGSQVFVAGYRWSEGATDGRLRIVDATNLRRPRVVGDLELPGAARDLALHVVGSRAYLAGGALGVRIVDVADVEHPTEIGSVPSQAARDCRTEGDRLYVAELRGMSVYDLADPAGPRLLGRWLGMAFDRLGVVAERAFLFQPGWGVLVVDVSDPTAMIAVGTFLDQDARAMDALGGAAFLASGGAGLRVVDTSVLRPPAVAGAASLAALPQGLAVKAETVYVAADEAGLLVVDMRDPSRPREMAALDTPGRALAVAVSEDLAFVADGEGGLRVIDVRDPTTPAEVGSWTAGPAMDVDVAGSTAGVVGWSGLPGRPELSVIDVSDPSAPVRVGGLEIASYDVFRVRMSAEAAFVLASPASIEVIDLSVPSAPRVSARIAVPSATDFDAQGGRLFVASPNAGLVVVDVSDPASPSSLATVFALGGADRVAALAEAVVVSGRFDRDAGRWVRLLDVSDPVVPRETGLIELPDHPAPAGAPFAPTGNITDVAVGAGRAYVTTDYHAGGAPARGYLVAIDADPASPARHVGLMATVSGHAVAASDNRAYVLGGGTLHVVDASDRSAPRLLGSLAGLPGGADIAADGRIVVLVDAAGDLEVIDVADAARPRLVGGLHLAEGAAAVAVSDGIACIAAGAQGLRLVDVRDPAAPTAMGSVDTLWATDVAVSGKRAVALGRQHVTVVDVSDPSAPAVLGRAATAATMPADVTLIGDMAYAVSSWPEGDPGLVVVDCHDPTAPRVVAETTWPAYSAAVGADPVLPAAVVLDAFATLHLVDASRPDAPRQSDVAGLAAPGGRRGPGRAALVVADGWIYALTDVGLTIVRTVAHPIAARLHLPFAAVERGG